MKANATDETRLDEACAWAARLAGDDADWAAFTLWLEADPRNSAAYDCVARAEADIDALRAELRAALPANDDGPRTNRRWLAWSGAAAAAAVAALISIPATRPPGEAPPTAYSSGASAGRSLRLAGGIGVRLDARTTLKVAEGISPRFELESGTAFFDVARDPARPMVVAAGGYEIRDIGTKFDLTRSGDHVSVAVAEGAVEVAAAGSASGLPVRAGERLDLNAAGRPAIRSAVDPSNIATWRQGRLSYRNTPLALVAADVSRYAPHPVIADARVADLRFSGVIEIGDGTRLVERLQQFLPVDATERGSETRLVPRGAR